MPKSLIEGDMWIWRFSNLNSRLVREGRTWLLARTKNSVLFWLSCSIFCDIHLLIIEMQDEKLESTRWRSLSLLGSNSAYSWMSSAYWWNMMLCLQMISPMGVVYMMNPNGLTYCLPQCFHINTILNRFGAVDGYSRSLRDATGLVDVYRRIVHTCTCTHALCINYV